MGDGGGTVLEEPFFFGWKNEYRLQYCQSFCMEATLYGLRAEIAEFRVRGSGALDFDQVRLRPLAHVSLGWSDNFMLPTNHTYVYECIYSNDYQSSIITGVTQSQSSLNNT